MIRFSDILRCPLRNGIYKPKQFHGTGQKIVNMGELFGYDFISNQEMKRIELNEREKEASLLENGDLLFARRSLVLEGSGKCSIVVNPSEEITFESSIIRARLDGSRAVPLFFYYLFKSTLGRSLVASIATRTAVSGITGSDLSQLLLPVPPKYVQSKVAEWLMLYDDLIENNTRRIKILEEMARMIYREWFVNFRFPGHGKIRMVESDLGQIPAGWTFEALENVCNRITDGSHWSPKSVGKGLPMASVKDMHNWGLDLSTCRQISDEDFETLIRNDCKPLVGDVLIAKDGSYLKHCFWVQKKMNVVILSSIAILRPSKRITPSYLSLHLLDPQIKCRMAGHVSGVALPRIILKDFRKFRVLVPPLPIQEAFSRLVEPILQLCWNLTERNSVLRQTRDLVLPKLIFGEIKVEDLESKAVAQGT